MNDLDLFGEMPATQKAEPVLEAVPEYISEAIPDEAYTEVIEHSPMTRMPETKPAASPMSATAHTQSGDNLLAIIEKIAMNPDADVAKLEKILDLQERVLNKEAEQAFSAAMAACQAEMPAVFKSANNNQTHSKYAKFEDILSVCKPVTTKHGFAVSFGNAESPIENHVRITCEVSHAAGHSKHYFKDLPIDNSGMTGKVNKTLIHGKASSETYGKRYLFTGVFNIAVTDDDNDGNKPPVEVAVISAERLQHLKNLIDETESDEKMFCTVCKVKDLAELPASKFDQALKLLQDKKTKMNSNK